MEKFRKGDIVTVEMEVTLATEHFVYLRPDKSSNEVAFLPDQPRLLRRKFEIGDLVQEKKDPRFAWTILAIDAGYAFLRDDLGVHTTMNVNHLELAPPAKVDSKPDDPKGEMIAPPDDEQPVTPLNTEDGEVQF